MNLFQGILGFFYVRFWFYLIMIKKIEFDNNVVLLLHQIPEAKVSSFGFWFSVGSRSEKAGEYGITHFTEHMLFKGTTKRTTHEIACSFDRIGGMVNAFTERENVCLYCTVPASDKNTRTALEVLSDMSENSIFPSDELEKERSVVENEVLAVFDDSEECGLDFMSQNIWKGSSFERNITGSVDDVNSITREKLLDYYDKHFRKGELVVCAAGNVSEDDLKEHLSKLGMHEKYRKYPENLHHNEKPVFHSGFFSKKASYNQAQIYNVFPMKVPFSESEYFTLCVLNALSGDTMTSRLFESLREKKGLCYSVYSFFTYYEDLAAWISYVNADRKKTMEVCLELRNQFKLLFSEGVLDEEIEWAKEHLIGEEIISGEDPEYLMKMLQRNFSLGFPLRETKENIECIRKVSKSDIIKLISELIDFKNSALVVYGAKLSKKQKGILECRIK